MDPSRWDVGRKNVGRGLIWSYFPTALGFYDRKAFMEVNPKNYPLNSPIAGRTAFSQIGLNDRPRQMVQDKFQLPG